jgi:hypothetical protein
MQRILEKHKLNCFGTRKFGKNISNNEGYKINNEGYKRYNKERSNNRYNNDNRYNPKKI